ncbi:MAG: 16S rRNA (guanine(527)-N(7))-methyltransferase RsmG [Desulfofustis sp.]|nr:16S rRNA (guanine(527)-N(7))-methyltransferase RsmG [Desulfofustis sp.]
MMEFDQFEPLLITGAKKLGVELDNLQTRRLYDYFMELKHWSSKVNLISRSASDEEIVDLHFLDSLALLGLFRPAPTSLLDVGSGAGFPGLVCKAVQPEMKVALVEARLKRVSFLRHVCRLLGLVDVEVHGCRLEDGTIADESDFRWVVSRAVAGIGDVLTLCGRFREYGSAVVCMKGPGYLEELKTSADATRGWHLVDKKTYRLPYSGAQRALLVFRGAD